MSPALFVAVVALLVPAQHNLSVFDSFEHPTDVYKI